MIQHLWAVILLVGSRIKKTVCTKLNISYKNESYKIYCLTWNAVKGNTNYKGEGTLCDDIYTENYW